MLLLPSTLFIVVAEDDNPKLALEWACRRWEKIGDKSLYHVLHGEEIERQLGWERGRGSRALQDAARQGWLLRLDGLGPLDAVFRLSNKGLRKGSELGFVTRGTTLPGFFERRRDRKRHDVGRNLRHLLNNR